MQSKPNTDHYANSNRNSNSNSNIDAYGYRNFDCHAYINSDSDADSETDADSQSWPVAKTSPDAYAAPDRLGSLCCEAFAIRAIESS